MQRRRATIAFATAALALTTALVSASAADASTAGANPPGYYVHRLCGVPSHGHVACLGLRLRPKPHSGSAGAVEMLRAAQTRSPPAGGTGGISPRSSTPQPEAEPQTSPKPVRPAELHTAYALPSGPAEGSPTQTIAIIDAYDDPTAEADLQTFDEEFGLPACTHADGCFTKVNQRGEEGNLPPVEGGWAVEIATDVETAHSICESCKILLVEASSSGYSSLEAAETTAWKLGATEISNSWGGEEPGGEGAAFNRPGVVITASAGDDGYLNWDEANTGGEAYFEGANYPASSPHVVAVGGTSLTVSSTGQWLGESVWNNSSGASGGGCSTTFAAPSWQTAAPGWSAVGCGSMRAVADVAADGDPYTGVAVYDSTPESPGGKSGWMVIGGTSVASPIIAATFALAGGADGAQYPAQTLYSHMGSSALHDVQSGGNGECDGIYSGGCSGSMSPLSPLDCGEGFTICNATAGGYDGPTGVGTPDGIAAFQPGASAPGEGTEPGGTEGEEGPAEEPSGEEGPAEEPSGEEAPTEETLSEAIEEEAGEGSPEGEPAPQEGTAGPVPIAEAPALEATGNEQRKGHEAKILQRPRVRRLHLRRGAAIALGRRRPRIARVAFAFRLTRTAKVRVTLARRMRIHGRMRWVVVRRVQLRASHGLNLMRLHGRRRLRRGRWRLIVKALGGSARSLRFGVR